MHGWKSLNTKLRTVLSQNFITFAPEVRPLRLTTDFYTTYEFATKY